MSAAVTIARAGPESVPAIAALLAAVLEPAWSEDSVAQYLAAPGSFALLAFPEASAPGAAGAEPAGFLLARVGGESCDLAAMGVAPRARGRGLGAALLEEALKTAAGMGARQMFLEVAEGNRAAIALYESRGFRVAGKRARYYPGAKPADALVMCRDLAAGAKARPEKSPPRP